MENFEKKLTPLMKQYWDVKSAHKDKILFFRMGDFYELFDQDAIIAAPILGIALTSRNKNHGDSTAMCGMPHHSVHNYINKLLAHNFKVAICDQIEDPKEAKGIVKRAVTRVLSPGMVYDPETLEATKSNYICAYDSHFVSFLEATTGEAFSITLQKPLSPNETIFPEVEKLIQILSPSELVLNSQQYDVWIENKKTLGGPCLTPFQFEKKLSPEIYKSKNATAISSQALMDYAVSMQGEVLLNTMNVFEVRELSQRMEISENVLQHLEIFETYGGQSKGSFFHAINKTQTSAGARKLKNWILFPLMNVSEITQRQNKIQSWTQDLSALKQIRSLLAQMGDIERRLGKISNPNCNARDLIYLNESLKIGREVSSLMGWECSKLNATINSIDQTLREDPPLSIREGHLIKEGFSKELDEYIQLSTHSQNLLTELENREKEKTQISSLKVRYNQVFGYYIEVTKTHSNKVPLNYVRKQTLTNAERYITEELQKLESKILSAQTKRAELEYFFFDKLRAEILEASPILLKHSQNWAELDVYTSLAWLAVEKSYVRPQFQESQSLLLEMSRHPVVEQITDFVPNTIQILPHGCLLLTGPNMAGKSTLMRQVGLICWMAQMGSFVPAQKAILPTFDRIFTRIGASDSLSEGLSTFMVEMKETADLLKNATSKSLVILDEIGRGTSTFDGMSLAQAILVYLVEKVRSVSFFATHYHELTTLVSSFPQIQNGHMKVSDSKNIRFLYTLEEGPANKSYGIEVAKLAGLPTEVTTLARKILESKESQKKNENDLPLFYLQEEESISKKNDSPAAENHFILNELISAELSSMSPLQALNKIHEWQKTLKQDSLN